MSASPRGRHSVPSTLSEPAMKDELDTQTGDAIPIDPQLLDAPPVAAQGPKPSTITLVTVYASPPTDSVDPPHVSGPIQRTWPIRTALLTTHSTFFRTRCSDPLEAPISLDLPSSMALSTFQDFVDFIHSSIYSPSKLAPDYHVVGTHLCSWVLGTHLGAEQYKTAALHEVYTWLEPLARSANKGRGYNVVRAVDVAFLCSATEEGDVMRAMVIDAVVAHWSQRDVLAIDAALMNAQIQSSSPHPGSFVAVFAGEAASDGDEQAWVTLYTAHQSFRKRVQSSRNVSERHRGRLLREVEEYIAGTTAPVEEEFEIKKRAERSNAALFSSPGATVRGREAEAALEGRHMRSPSRRRRSSAGSVGEASGLVDGERYMTEDGGV
ncbi:hypothetical protein BU23DRAFT_635576 [Bimuria novae-zelandiae CBS 107.79]|uniref:BTB domain-containing protein n=1 Tax=Bimuria novae-zelandiae CBS 107.79 TaxID=1447943 RepID=A0A6A5VN33_9PLEO|nr:hypothetical protein BU23DRAFT_635576 [Bimuria novae-zelandiae CBS 107.79]